MRFSHATTTAVAKDRAYLLRRGEQPGGDLGASTGVAAWLAHATAPPVVTTHAKAPITATPIASDVDHSDLICVLANIAMAISPEVHA